MKATVELPDTLFARLENEAASRQVRVEDLLTAYVEAGLSGGATPRDVNLAPAGETDFARLQREERELRDQLRARGSRFSASDRLPREELYDRHALR